MFHNCRSANGGCLGTTFRRGGPGRKSTTLRKKSVIRKVAFPKEAFPVKKPKAPRDPSTIVNRTVTPRRPRNANLREREYLTPKEVDRLQDAARKHSRYGHRDATAILVAYRHGLRNSLFQFIRTCCAMTPA